MSKSRERDLKPFVLLALGLCLLHMSWLKWVNVTLDYGRELYTPWRISCGQVLYKDIASLFGPFPPYWNALLFKIFGVSIMTLAAFNIFLVACITALIYRIFSFTAGKRAAFFASAAFLCLFAFAQSLWDRGLFNYICPYSYSVTYAVFFALWAIDLFIAQPPLGKNVWWAGMGFLMGLTILSRFEIFFALTVVLVPGFIFKGIAERWGLKRFLKAGAFFLAGFFVPIVVAYLYFSSQLPLSQVWPSILGVNAHGVEIFHTTFYIFWSGLDDPRKNSIYMLATAACYGIIGIALKLFCVGLDRVEKNSRRWEGVIFILIGLAAIALVVDKMVLFHRSAFRGVPLMMAFMAGYFSWLLVRHRQDEEKARRILPLLMMTVWGLLMIMKVILRVWLNSEAFVYAMPAVLMFVVLWQGFVPAYFERVHARGAFISVLVSLLLVALVALELVSTAHVYRLRISPLRSGPDTIFCDASDLQAGNIASFLKAADKIMAKDANFVVFPDGVMLNFLTKRVYPSPYVTLAPAEMIDYGGEKMLRSFKEHRPDYLIFCNIWLFRYHYPLIDETYPSGMKEWAFSQYTPIWHGHLKGEGAWILLKHGPVWREGLEDEGMITLLKRRE